MWHLVLWCNILLIGIVQTLEADFEGRNPDASDFHGIQQLLKQLFLKAHINLTQLSDMIIAQQGIGSVLKQSMDDDDDEDEDDDTNSNDVFGITTIINLTANNVSCNNCFKTYSKNIMTSKNIKNSYYNVT